MKKFDFRLQKVLDYRRLEEQWAKDALMQIRAERLLCEQRIAGCQSRRRQLLGQPMRTLEDRRQLDQAVLRLDEEERLLGYELQGMQAEEAGAMSEWQQKREDRKVLETLWDKSYAQWVHAVNKAEQDALDEWATMRRAG